MIQGHVITRRCVFRPDIKRWEPSVTIKPSWDSTTAIELVAPLERFQYSPADAMDVATNLARTWLANAPPTGGSR